MCTAGNQRAAARLLGLKPTTLNSEVKMYNIVAKGEIHEKQRIGEFW